ncbi:LOW QUALITY PROTEIN: cyclic AMP-responsive element-binding protein 3 [Porphyrio hochstetteri]
MWCPGEQDFQPGEDLIDFLLRDDVPCPEVLREENTVLENLDQPVPEILDKDTDDLINSLLDSMADKPCMLQDYLLPTSDNSISEYQRPSLSPGNAFASSLQSSNILPVDHNYSLHQGCLNMQNMMSEMGEGLVFTDVGTCMDLEDRSKALKRNSFFPVAVDVKPQPVYGATVQPVFPGLPEEEKQLLVEERTSLPACQPLMNVNPHCSLSLPSGPGPLECFSQSSGSKIQDGALAKKPGVEKPCRKIRNQRSAQKHRQRKNRYQEDMEYRMAAYMAQNEMLEKKVEMLQKQNMSLLNQVQRLEALVRQSNAETATGESHSSVSGFSTSISEGDAAAVLTSHGSILVLHSVTLRPLVQEAGYTGNDQRRRPPKGNSLFPSCGLCVGPSSEQDGEAGDERAGSTSLAVMSRQTRKLPNRAASDGQQAMVEGCSQEPHNLSLRGSLNQPKEEQSPPNPDPRPSFNCNLSSDPPVAVSCRPHPQEQCSQSDPLQAAVRTWNAGRQEWVEHCVIQQHCADEMQTPESPAS